MKKSIIMIAVVVLTTAAYAQKPVKPNINKANIAREKGELAEAKEIIDLATTYEKTKDDGKTWYYRGLIYATLDTTTNPQYTTLSENALQIAMESFEKSDELAGGKAYFTTSATGLPILKDQQVDAYYGYYFNGAVTKFQNEEFQGAVDMFLSAAQIVKGDTNSYKNAAYAAHNGQLFPQAVANYQKSIDAGARSIDMYTNLMNILIVEIKDSEAALNVVREAKKVYPTDKSLSKSEINLLISLNKVEEAKENLINAIAEEPNNPGLYFALAAMYEELGDFDKALATYNKGIEADPNDFNCNFNKGVILLNRANDIIKEISNLGVTPADRKREKELQQPMKQKLNEALPQWLKLNELKPNDRQVLEMLSYIYNRLKNYDEAEKYMDLLDALPPAE
jgi:tetratricopeptide (TPR) repeat protein